MIKTQLLAFSLLANLAFSQTANFAKAPNSYIYDIDLAKSNNYGGFEIPVKKAYEMWSNYEYLKSQGASTPIPAGVQSASLYWEDIPGLVENVSIIKKNDPSNSKIKIEINNAKGKGNAVVAFKVDDKIYWSWHIWVTDNPSNGVKFNQGFETDIAGNPFNFQYMDRNLGATSNDFLGNEWQKTGGLMYEWGRKDPFPPLIYKDASYYEISGEVGVLRHKQIDNVNTIPVQVRPFNEIGENIRYSVNNPITYIVNTESSGNWFSNQRYKVPGTSPNYTTWDLWSDNAKGGNSNGNSSNAALKKESRSYELKSELDPCPNGWRVPSYYGRETPNNNLSFFGKNDWNNDDNVVANRQLFPNSENPNLSGIKVYPGIGMDFTNAQSGNRNLGKIAVSGGYVYYPNSVAPNAPVGVTFQDNAANGGLWSATFGYDGARIFSMISDPFRTNTTVGLHAIFNNQTNPTKSGNAVKCMRDPNMALIGNFATEYFTSEKMNFTDGLDLPNSYMVVGETELTIPVKKAFAVYNQLLTDHEMPPSDDLMVKVLWTTNPDLISELELNDMPTEITRSSIQVKLNPGQSGNAVISLHNGNRNNPALWSWHIWVPKDDPTQNTIVYKTETPISTPYNFVNATTSKMPVLETTFMDRNLGAESSDLESGSAYGLHYQWGRKDPLPNFANKSAVYSDSQMAIAVQFQEIILRPGLIEYGLLQDIDFLKKYTKSYPVYGSTSTVASEKIRENLKYSVQNPLTFLYQKHIGAEFNGGNIYSNNLENVKDWISDDRGEASERWGHGTEKSVFDPCPEGWRVPDVSFTNLYTGSKGNSPWFNGYRNDAYGKPGVIQNQWHPIANFYNGEQFESTGWKFTNPNYNIGVFPNDGIRGELGENKLSFSKSGVWTAALADMNTGFALAMQFEGSKMQTGTGVYPQAAMSVRCAKDQTRILNTQSTKYKKIKVVDKPEAGKAPFENGLKIYPNPFKNEVFINGVEAEKFEIYDFSGKLVLSGNVNAGKIDAATIPAGMYLVKIKLKDGSALTKKLIKQ